MRRSERQVTDLDAIRDLLAQGQTLHLALNAEGAPYVVPLNYGFSLAADGGLTLYLHSALQGRKLDLLRRDARVGFAISALLETVRGEIPCAWTARYRSLVGTGRVSVLTDPEEQRLALEALLQHMGFSGRAEIPAASLERVAVLRIDVESYTCKSNVPR
ncbi:MAG: pyridoxamine 5'-phosphate oxidase family protein [Candidatus Spyradocola sp.]|jgi:nitroimidazol reductase NimA-like FMN-containing flavoprotein (pyridoxamine 5'-phosphate oxidase superfamily)